MNPELPDQDTSLVTSKTPLGNYPGGSLFVTHGERAGQEIPINRESFFIGRSHSNDLVLDDRSVSRRHAVINVLGGEHIISDLNSLKGTYVNGRKIEEVALKVGDIINIGETRMQFRLLGPGGRWLAGGRRGGVWYLLAALIIGVVIGMVAWVFIQKHYSGRISDEVMAEIELRYDRGVGLFNKEHDVAGAREEWERILELDPERRTDFAIKAAKLLNDTEAGAHKE